MAAPIPKDGKQSDPRYQLFTTVYTTCFSPCGRYLVAGNNFGKIAVYSLSSALSPDATEENKAPLYIYRAHDGPIYSFSSTDTFLISAGTRDVLGWKWKDLIAREPKVAWVLAIPRGDGFESPETNALALSNTSNGTQTLYAGCGDNNIYGWELDTGTCVMTMKGHSDFVHCLATKNSGNELVSGSEDGSVRIWDPRCPEEHVQMFEPSKHDVCSRPKLGPWISCVAADPSDDWIVCGGGPALSLWHTRSLSTVAATFPTPDACQFRALFNEDVLLSGGSQPSVMHWDLNGAQTAKVPVSPPCVYDIQINAASDQNQVMVVAGSSYKIDVCTNYHYKAFSLTF